jgi:hypothetical protein
MLVIPLVLACMSRASADDPVKAAQNWGLIGTWAVDCAVRYGRQPGTHLVYFIREGTVIYRRDGDAADNPIGDARIEPDHSLIFRVTLLSYNNETRDVAYVKAPDGGSFHALYDRGSDGTYAIRDSMVVANGQQAPTFHRCE